MYRQPLREMPLEPKVRGLLFDIDDTFTTDGRITPRAFSALADWADSGHLAIAVTGRSAGWCDHIARMWPVNAVVGENGAFWFAFDQRARHMQRWIIRSEAEREASKQAFSTITHTILEAVPQARVAADQAYRISDLAIDFAEDCGPLPLEDAQRIAAIMTQAGMTAKVSSIHVNGWFGNFDKLTTTRLLAQDLFDITEDQIREGFVYIGDSPNDSPMFSYFSRSVGVANVARYEGLIDHWPKFVCSGESGAGFAEVVRHMLAHGA